VLGCVDSSGTKTCNCNTDLCNRGKASHVVTVNVFAVIAMTFASTTLAFTFKEY
jgi:hypothetical protein